MSRTLFKWGWEETPPELDKDFVPGCILPMSPEYRAWSERLNAAHWELHHGPDAADEISFRPLAKVFP